MGLPGKPNSIDGSQVAQYYRDGRIREIADYCESDVVNTYRVWLRHELFQGKLDTCTYPVFSENTKLMLPPASLCGKRSGVVAARAGAGDWASRRIRPAGRRGALYARQDVWQQTVEAIVPLCQLVVWTTGHTEGLRWEIKHLLENVPPQKLLL